MFAFILIPSITNHSQRLTHQFFELTACKILCDEKIVYQFPCNHSGFLVILNLHCIQGPDIIEFNIIVFINTIHCTDNYMYTIYIFIDLCNIEFIRITTKNCLNQICRLFRRAYPIRSLTQWTFETHIKWYFYLCTELEYETPTT